MRTHPALWLGMALLPVGLFLFLPSDRGKADVPPPPPLTKAPRTAFECRWAGSPITVDGKPDDAAWKNAQVIDTFYLPWLQEKARPARTGTKARLLWDREYLYFLAEMEDTDLYADVTEHNGQTWDNDVFELFFKPAADKPGYYEFQVNAAGTVFDLFQPRRGAGGLRRFGSKGEFHVEAKVKLDGTLNKWTDTDKGWTVEGRIPWSDFLRTGGRPNPGEKWKFALCRYDYSVDFDGPELSTCAPLKSLTHPDFHHHEDYATLTFIGPDAKTDGPVGIEKRVPLTTSTVQGSPDPPSPYRLKRVLPDISPNFPIHVVRQPGSDRMLYIGEKGPYGTTSLHRFVDKPGPQNPELLFEIDGIATDLCFHPDFAHNGYLYLGWNGPSSGKPKYTRVTRYTMARTPPYALDPKSATLIIEWLSDGHNGAAVCFGNDGMLYVTSGDGTSDSDTNIVGQRLDTMLAKVLRIDVDHPAPGKLYSVPKDNPFVDVKDAKPETYAYGVRNPWRITSDRESGQIWVGQNGQDLWEQAYLLTKGANYGWSVYEGSHDFYPKRKLGPTPLTKPTVEHSHADFRSLTGGVVYRGKRFPELVGAYIYGDYSTGKVWGIKVDTSKGERTVVWHKELATTQRLAITGFGIDTSGELLICDHHGGGKGGFYTLEPTPKGTISTFPRTLSTSGLFRSVKDHRMQPALVPYSVNAPFWSDGAHKERWIALPGADSVIEFTRNRGWNFPDGTVLVKSFALELEEGRPESRRWIETRFLTRQEGEWYGYSYQWNEDGNDGTLVGGGGADKKFTIRVPKSEKYPEGIREQVWHYPSRSECMVCHSRAANFVLGLSELQMNKIHDYGGVRANQLRTLEHLSMLRVNYYEEAKTGLQESLKAKGVKDVDAMLERMTATRLQRSAQSSSLLTFAPESYRKLVDPYDGRADLTARARSFLHSNCSTCHVEAGGGNSAMELEFTTKADAMRVLDVKPLHNTFGLTESRLIAPGVPERSVLLRRISTREPGHMPPLSTNRVDEAAVKMLREWIVAMKAEKKGT
jgi:uncharacterized repeat protein (TIGR03806 family)